ncbi:guanitoxin biosynthesis MBL fold metallo-hydrolase GntH [Rhodococcus sp. NPDC127530]|uniref:guanitoxin biosynthesis MBL fold metallo-hydrolase GntH n=1 Tax=unclassified Rhodococcus (in: high G+C Gram-positive bacteria) TaxID=192944 RepID=UPI003636C078
MKTSSEPGDGAATAKNPYGGRPGSGISLPPYFRPTPSVRNASNYFPVGEKLGPDEMRISFVGSCPFPPRRDQAGTSIMVELGNGDRFFFDLGSGCLRNIVAMQVPIMAVNDIFLSHLHVDHFADLPYLYCFAPWLLRWKPLRVHGPSGRTPKDGTKFMIEGMKQMTHWHTKSFKTSAVGDGYEVEVNEFDWQDENGLCYDKNGVQVRHWPRSHVMDGASAYRLDWNGLSFVWTGDGRPDKLTLKHAKDVDVFVTEVQADLGAVSEARMGIPQLIGNTTIDSAHTIPYAVGYLLNQLEPRLGMVTHLEYDRGTAPEIIAGVRTHYDGWFEFGVDVTVVNVTKDAIWVRDAVLPDAANPARPDPTLLLSPEDLHKLQSPTPATSPPEIAFPNPEYYRDEIQEQATRDAEIDPKDYYPPDVYREQTPNFPKDFRMKLG